MGRAAARLAFPRKIGTIRGQLKIDSIPMSAPSFSPPAPVKLIVLDYDFTVHDWETQPSVDEGFIEHMAVFQAMGGLFAINSGRTLEQMTQGLLELDEGLQPDYLLTTEREVYRPNADGSGGWEEFGDWNARCRQAHDELALRAADLLSQLAEQLAYRYRGMRLVWENHRLSGLVASHAGEMELICRTLEERLAAEQHRQLPLSYQRNDIYLRFCHREYHKGAALGELKRLLGLSAGEVFAAGDNHNDLSMLRREMAEYLACPGNSIGEVKEFVTAQGGYVARARCSLGLREALAHYRVPGWAAAKETGAAA